MFFKLLHLRIFVPDHKFGVLRDLKAFECEIVAVLDQLLRREPLPEDLSRRISRDFVTDCDFALVTKYSEEFERGSFLGSTRSSTFGLTCVTFVCLVL